MGQTESVDFPLVGAIISKTEPNANAAFITKVNPLTGQILFSTKLGGTAVEPSGFAVGTIANAVALDMAGNIYVAGMTNAADFPGTPEAFQKRTSRPAALFHLIGRLEGELRWRESLYR